MVTELRDPVFRRDLLLLALAAALLFLPGLGRRDLWNPDEARYAQVAREMSESGSWSLPRLNHAVYTQKPPLFFWLVAAGARLTGGDFEVAVRLPSALAAIAATLLVFRIGSRLFGRRAAWLAAAAFATSFKVLWQGRFGQIDMLLTALVALSVWWFVRGYTERRPALYWLFFATAGLATITKGPAGFLPPLLAIVAFLLVSGERHEIGRLRIGRGLLLWAAVVLAWLVPAAVAGGREYLDQIVLRQNLTRYADPWHHFRPWYYYLKVIPGEFLPWSLLLPGLFAVRRELAGETRRGVRLALCWAVVTVVFFSLSPAKRSVYVLTMYPALALLVGVAMDRLAAEWPRRRRWATVPLAVVAFLAAAVAAAAPFAGRGRPELAAVGGERVALLVSAVMVPLLAGAAWGLWLAHRGRVGPAAAALAAGVVGMWLPVAAAVLPRFDAVKSARALADELEARLGPRGVYGIYPRLDAAFLFYSNHYAVPLDSPEALRDFASQPREVWVLAQRDDWAKLDSPPPLVEVARDRDELSGYLLLTRPEIARRAPGRPVGP